MISILHLVSASLIIHNLTSAALIPLSSQTFTGATPTTNVTGETGCNLPYLPPFCPISPGICDRAFRILLNSQGSSLQRNYRKLGPDPIKITKLRGCGIYLNGAGLGTQIDISLKQVVGYAKEVLELCEMYGQGGWTRVDGSRDWIVAVNGFGP